MIQLYGSFCCENCGQLGAFATSGSDRSTDSRIQLVNIANMSFRTCCRTSLNHHYISLHFHFFLCQTLSTCRILLFYQDFKISSLGPPLFAFHIKDRISAVLCSQIYLCADDCGILNLRLKGNLKTLHSKRI
ncbi:hypothetical protein AB6A40_005112 [Gnathostoma spinigerum]|uniref:Uncharacterized protein n=1 Tax=Gnathostoma spinigerum TaxID=75299 RepID=A0ABD6EN54_9BILA